MSFKRIMEFFVCKAITKHICIFLCIFLILFSPFQKKAFAVEPATTSIAVIASAGGLASVVWYAGSSLLDPSETITLEGIITSFVGGFAVTFATVWAGAFAIAYLGSSTFAAAMASLLSVSVDQINTVEGMTNVLSTWVADLIEPLVRDSVNSKIQLYSLGFFDIDDVNHVIADLEVGITGGLFNDLDNVVISQEVLSVETYDYGSISLVGNITGDPYPGQSYSFLVNYTDIDDNIINDGSFSFLLQREGESVPLVATSVNKTSDNYYTVSCVIPESTTPDTYDLVLSAKSDGNPSRSISSQITIFSNDATVPKMDVSPNPAYVGDVVSLDGSRTYDPDGDSYDVWWDVKYPDGSKIRLSYDLQTTFTPTVGGHYFIYLTASDGYETFTYYDVEFLDVKERPVDTEYSPNASRVYPDYSTDHLVGDEIKFKVRGFDVDDNLSHVLWRTDGPIELQGNEMDYFESSESREGTEYIRAKITSDNNGEHFYLYATVYDKLGNHSDTVKWVLEARESYTPQLYTPIPAAGDVNVLLGETTFSVTVYDADDNAGGLDWSLDGEVISSDGTGGGGVPTEEHQDFTFVERATYIVKASIEDEDGNTNEIIWNVIAGSPADGNLPPIIDYIGIEPSEYPYTLFRVGKGYEFRVEASDPDVGLIYNSFLLDGSILYEDDWNTGTASDKIDRIVSFSTTGDHIIKCIARDNNGEQVEDSITVNVLSADGTEGSAPQFISVYPGASMIYSPAGESILVGGTFYDADWDADHIEVYLNNSQIGNHQSISGDSSFDFYVSRNDLPTSGTHQLKIIPVDAGGKEGTPKTWSLSISQGNHAPTIKRAIPDIYEPIYVLADDSNPPSIYVFAEDVDGDLDRVVFDWSGVGDPDPDDSGSLSRHFDEAHHTFHPTKSGTVRATVYDEVGRSSSVTFDIVVVNQLQNHAPQILHCNIANGSTTERATPNYHYDISLALDAYDPDGDLVSVELFQDGILIESRLNINDYEMDESFESNANESDFANFEGPDTKTRGQHSEFLLRLTDSKSNVTERTWSVIQGPIEDNNHAPVVPVEMAIELNQRKSLEFTVSVQDEEGDEPATIFTGLPLDHQLEKLTYNQFRYTPDPAFYGTVNFVISWNDRFGGLATTSIQATINQVKTAGDINDDGVLDLSDLIQSLRLLAGDEISVSLNGDVDGDLQIGLAETIYILQTVSSQ